MTAAIPETPKRAFRSGSEQHGCEYMKRTRHRLLRRAILPAVCRRAPKCKARRIARVRQASGE